MKKFAISAIAFAGILFAVTLVSNLPVRAHDEGQDREDRKFESEIKIGFEIAPVPLNLRGKNPALVGLGSYIVNAQGGCNDCHTCPSYVQGTNPMPPPFGAGVPGHGIINPVNYLAGGVSFTAGPVTVVSKNITPDATGKPDGLTLEELKKVIRTALIRVTMEFWL
jgi:hypothetical protein